MATRFWVGGTGNFDASTTTHWAATTGGAGGASVPGAADDVTFDANSGAAATVTATAAYSVKSITINKADLTLTHTAGSTVSGMMLLTTGTLLTGNQPMSWGNFSNTGLGTLTLGSSAISITGSGILWNFGAGSNLTFSAGTSVITFATGGTIQVASSGTTMAFATVILNGPNNYTMICLSTTFATLTRTGSAVKTAGLVLNQGVTVTGTFTVNGNSSINRLIVQSNLLGTTRTITAAVVVASYVDFMDITAAGAANWDLHAITGGCGDCLGNTGITFTTRQTNYWVTVGAHGNWSDVTKWASSSGGAASSGRVPLPQDDVCFDANSINVANLNVTSDMPRWGRNIDWTGVLHSPTLQSSAVQNYIFGNLTFVSGMTIAASNQSYNLVGRGTQTWTTGGNVLGYTFGSWIINAPGGSYTVQDSLSMISGLYLNAGTLDTTVCNVSVGYFSANVVGQTRSLLMGARIWTLINPNNQLIPWDCNVVFTLSAAAATILLAPTTSAASYTMRLGGYSYGTITYTQATMVFPLIFHGGGTIGTLNVGAGRVLTIFSSTTLSVATWNVSGSAYGYQYFPGLSGVWASAPTETLGATDLEVVARVSADNWIPLANSHIISKSISSTVFTFRLLPDGTLQLQVNNGTTTRQEVTSVATGFVNGTTMWLKATFKGDNGAGGSDTKFYYAADQAGEPSAWTQLGTTKTTATAWSIRVNADNFEMGTVSSGAQTWQGRIYRIIVRNGIAGANVLDANFSTKTMMANTFVESSANAATVTINGDALLAGDGRIVINASTAGTQATLSKTSGQLHSDYITLKDNAATGGAIFDMGVHSVKLTNVTGWGILYEATSGLTGAGSLGVTGTTKQPGTAALTGAGAINAPNAQRRALASTTLAGAGVISATGTNRDVDTAALSGAGTLSASGTLRGQDASTLLATGTLLAAALAREQGAAVLTGAGTLTAVGTNRDVDSAALTAQGTLIAAAVLHQQATVALTGSGRLTAVSRVRAEATLAVSGSGTLTDWGYIKGKSSVHLAASGTLSATGKDRAQGHIILLGQGTLLALGTGRLQGQIALLGQGVLEATGHAKKLGFVVLGGVGILIAYGDYKPTLQSDIEYTFGKLEEHHWIYGEIGDYRWGFGKISERRWTFGRIQD
jgi:hypothetical protein